jgi:1-phosphofructokinase family hexose kinase
VIIAAGLTPAWQQILRFDGFRTGEVNRASDVHWCASGKVLNVALALGHLGAPCDTIALLGGPPREQIEREFLSLGISARWIGTHWATRVCTTILDTRSGKTTELVENAGPVTDGELEQFKSAYRQAVRQADLAVLTGSLPRGVPRSLFRDVLAETPCRAILDVRGPELIEALECRPFLVKPNRQELSETLGRELADDTQLVSAMEELNQGGAQWVVVTHGAKPLWISAAGRRYRISPPPVEVVNPIGSGDCLAAGIAWALSLKCEPLEAIRVGVAAAVENAGQLLPGRIDPEAVRQRAEQLTVEAV